MVMTKDNRKNFDKLVSKKQSGWLEDAMWREENEAWLKRSAQIALMVLREIRKQKPVNGMTQKKLAEEMGVTPQYVNKIVKGQENLSLQTISKIESVLGIDLINIPKAEKTQKVEYKKARLQVCHNAYKQVGMTKTTVDNNEFTKAAEPELHYQII